MTTVNISGTWSEKQRPNNGLERVASYIHANRITRVPVVAYVEFHSYTEKLTGQVLTVAIPAIEPALEADGTDPDGLGKQLWEVLDQLRKRHGKGAVEDTLFSMPREGFDFDGPADGGGELDGQQELRLGPDGEHQVPPPSGEEVLAEHEEAKAEAAKASVVEATAAVAASDKAKGKAKPATDPFTPDGAK